MITTESDKGSKFIHWLIDGFPYCCISGEQNAGEQIANAPLVQGNDTNPETNGKKIPHFQGELNEKSWM